MEEKEDIAWQERTGFDPDHLQGAVEALIFMSDRPIGVDKIKKILGGQIPLPVLHRAIEQLQTKYAESSHGIDLREVAHGYQFRTKEIYAKFIRDFFRGNAPVLSSSVLEVLAIVAYRQPISKAEIERTRGVDSSHIVRALMEKRLVMVTGKSKNAPGRPTLYGTTKEFLETFNLATLSDLPPRHELEGLAPESVGSIADIVRIDAKMSGEAQDKQDEVEEGDILEKTIKAIPSATPFTKRLAALAKKKKDRNQDEEEITALDILEEHMGRERVINANRKAVASSFLQSKKYTPSVHHISGANPDSESES